MKKRHLFIVLILLTSIFSCEKEQKITVGKKITGDFNGDSKIDTASLKKIDTSVYDSAEFSVVFSDSSITKLNPSMFGRKVQLINEGDLNSDMTDEISISYESNKKVPISHMETQSYKNNKWKAIIPFFSLYPGFDTLSKSKLQNVVSKNKNSIEYYTYGVEFKFDKNFKPIDTIRTKKIIKLKK